MEDLDIDSKLLPGHFFLLKSIIGTDQKPHVSKDDLI